MNVNSLNGTSLAYATNGVDAIGTAPTPAGTTSASSPAANVSISTPGQLFGEMQQLSQQDPAAFKSVAAEVSTALQNAASQASGPQASFLSHLAQVFDQAAQTGSLAAPTQGGSAGQGQPASGGQAAGGAHHHHHHHGGGGAGNAQQSGTVQQALQGVLGIVTQALQGSSTASSTSST